MNFLVSGAFLDGRLRGLLNADGFISGMGYLLPDDSLMAMRVASNSVVPVQYTGTIIIGCNLSCRDYFHWWSQALPAIDNAVRREGQDSRITLALPQLNAWQKESLRILGHGALRRLTVTGPEGQYALNLAEFSQILNGGSAFTLSNTTWAL
ncbi:MAG: hypothetical protein ACJ8AI_30975 [Rhodopila sp.]